MFRGIKSLLPHLALGILILTWFVIGHRVTDLPDSAALEIAPSQLDLGVVEACSEYVHRISIRNKSSHRIALTGFNTSCNCLEVRPTSFSIDAGVENEIALRLNLQSRPESFPGQMEFPFKVYVTPTVNGLPSQRNWMIHGKVSRLVVADEPEVWVGTRVAGDSFTPVRSVRVRCREPLESVNSHCDPPWISSKVERFGNSGLDWKLTLLADKPQMPVGKVFGGVNLEARRRDGRTDTIHVCSFAAELAHDVELSQAKVVMSPQSIVAPSSQVVVLKSRSSREFKIASIHVDPPQAIEVVPTSLCDNAFGISYLLQLRNSCPDSCSFQVRFEVEQSDQLSYSLPVTVAVIDTPEIVAGVK
jgi:hypothetical protein